MKKIYFILVLCCLSFASSATTYYYRGGTFTTAANWNTNSAGGGTAATVFTSAADVWVVTSAFALTVNAAWTVAGAIEVGTTTGAAATCTISTNPTGTNTITVRQLGSLTASIAITGHAISVNNSGTLLYNVNTYPTWGTIGASSTISFGGAVAHTIPLITYGNLTLASSSTTNTFMSTAATSTYTVAGNMNITAGTWSLVSTASGTAIATLSVGGNFTLTTGTFKMNACTGGTATVNMNVAGTYNEAGTAFQVSAATLTGTYNNTLTVTGAATVSAGTFTLGAGYGTSTVNFNSTYAMSGTGAQIMCSTTTAGNCTHNITGAVTVTSTAATKFSMNTAGNTTAVTIIQANSDVTSSATGTYHVNWGGYTSTGYFGVKGNLSLTNTPGLFTSSSLPCAGFVFNGTGTAGSPQTLTATFSGSTQWGTFYTVNSGTYVKLLSNVVMGIGSGPYPTFTVNSGGTLDCSTFTISGGSATVTALNTGLTIASGATIATAHASGLNGSITCLTKNLNTGAKYIYNSTTATQVTGTFLPTSIVSPGAVTISNTFGAVTLSQALAMGASTTLTVGASSIFDLSTFALTGTFAHANSGTIRTSNTTATPIPSGLSWGGTIQYAVTTGGQTIVANTYNNLTVSNSSGTHTAGAAFTVNGTLATTTGGTLNMSTFAMNGTTSSSGTGTIRTQNTSATPFTVGRTWTPTMVYDNAAGGQTIVNGTYANLTNSNTSSANSTTAAVSVVGTLSLSASSALSSGNTISITGALTLTSSSTLTLGNTLTVNGTLTLGATTTISSGSNNINLAGNLAGTGRITASSGALAMTTASATISGATIANLTLNNASGFSLSGSPTITGVLTFTNGILTTGANTITVPGSGGVSGATTSRYVNGNLAKTITGLSAINFEIGDATYAPVSVSLDALASGGTMTVKSTTGLHPNIATSNLNNSIYINHYWTFSSTGTGFTTILPIFTYNPGDIIGAGSNAGFIGQIYNTGTGLWNSPLTSTTDPTATTTQAPAIATATLTSGNFAIGPQLPDPPVLTAAVGATVDDATIDITFPDDPAWRAAFSSITVNGVTLTAGSSFPGGGGILRLVPASSTPSTALQVSGSKTIYVFATGYAPTYVIQTINSGAATTLTLSVQPTAPPYNSGLLAVQPTVIIKDQYNNNTGSATVTASANPGSGSWSIGGTSSMSAVSGVAAFTDLTASSAALVTGASITFSSAGLTSVTSNTFNIPRPPISGTVTVPGDYLTLGQAITAVNQAGLSGPVTINCLADQFAPLPGDLVEGSVSGAVGGGYVINITNAYAPTATNTLTIQGNGHTVLSSPLATATNYNDAIFTIAGNSYITIDNFKMRDTSSNTIVAASNNMTEFGVALVRGNSTILGTQNCIISNCTITLGTLGGTLYTDGIGIYSNSSNSYNAVYTTATAATSAAGANSNNSFYGNTISGVTTGIALLGTAAFNDINNIVGGYAAGNTINIKPSTTNMVMGSAYANYSRTQQDGVYAVNNNNISVDYNTITLPSGATTNTANGINIGTSNASSSFTNQATYNNIVLRTAATTQYTGILNTSGNATYATLKFNNNNISVFGTSGIVYGINNSGAGVLGNFEYNRINDTITTATTAYDIFNTGAFSTATFNYDTCYNYSTSTGYFTGIGLQTGSISTANVDYNLINNSITGAASGVGYGVYNNGAAIPNLSISYNDITMAHTGTSLSYGINNSGAASNGYIATGNTVTIASAGHGIYNTGVLGTGTFTGNTVYLRTPGTAVTYGIFNNANMTSATATGNNISTLAVPTAPCYGIYFNGGTITGTAAIRSNTINAVAATAVNSFGIASTCTAGTYIADSNIVTLKHHGLAIALGIYYAPLTFSNNVYIRNNTIDLSTTAATTTAAYFIYNQPTTTPPSGIITSIQNNTFKSTNGLTNTTGLVYLVLDNTCNATDSVCFNRTQGRIIKSGSGGTFYGIHNLGVGTSTVGNVHYGNNISNISLAGTTAFIGMMTANSTAMARLIAFDTISHISSGSGNITGSVVDYCTSVSTMRNNYVDSLITGGNIYALTFSLYNGPGGISGSALGASIYNNIVDSLYGTGASSSVYGLNISGLATSTSFSIYSNTIRNLAATATATTAPSLYGIYYLNGLSQSIYSNSIYNFTTLAGASANAKAYGISSTTAVASTTSIYKNNIHDISTGNSGGATTQANGIYIPGATASTIFNVYNNNISNITAPSANNYDAVVGINMTSTNPVWNVFYNNIYLPGLTGSTNFGAAGILFPTGSTLLSLKNNIINMNTSTTLSGTGIASCVRRNVSGTGGVAPTTSNYDGNYNVYYVNSGARNYFYAEQTAGGAVTNGYNLTTDANFNACGSNYKTYMTSGGRESLTYTENNLANTGTGDSTYSPPAASFAYHGGIAISSPSITDDYLGVTRNNPPSIGSSEFTGSYPSNGAPVITYTALNSISYCIAAPPSLSAAITSVAGVNTTAGTKPRLYYRTDLDANAYVGNTSADNGWKYVEASNSSSPFTFTPDYSLLFNAAAVGRTVSYFVVAQDLNVTPLVASKTVGYAAGYCPSSVALTSGAFPTVASPTINSYVITAVPSFTATTAPSFFCGTSSPAVLTVSPSPSDLVLQWQQDYGSGYSNISGATSNNYVATPPTLSGTSATVNYKADAYCNGGVVATSSVAAATEYNPTVTTTTPGDRCGAGTVTLGATGPGGTTLEWFAASTGGLPIGVGTSFVTPSISSNTIYYVADSMGSYGTQTVGQTAITGATLFNAGTGGPGTGINFTVNNAIKIQSVSIYAGNSGGIFSISVYSGSTPIATYTGTTVASGGTTPQVVPVNFYIPPGSYQMCFSALDATAALQYGSLTSAFPYTSNYSTMTMTSTTYLSYYFFFYNWQVSAACTSPRTAVTATIGSLPTAGTATGSPSSVCSGVSISLSETGTPTGTGTLASYSWTGPNSYSSTGAGPTISPVVFTPTTIASSGYYSLTVTYPGTGCTSTPVASNYVTVNAATTPVLSGTLSACVAGTRTLLADIPSGTWTSDNTGIASVDASSGVVTAVAAGTANITYTTPCGSYNSAVFTVNTTPAAITGETDLCINLSTTLSNTEVGGTWSSTNTFVATVNSSTGVVYSQSSSGSTTISYTIGSCATSTVFHVNNTGPASITGASSVCVNGATTLSNATPGGSWTTADPLLATVTSGGIVTGIAGGTVDISYSTGCGTDVAQTMTINGSSITISNNGPICHGSTLNLSSTGGFTTYSWVGPNGFTSTLQNPSISTAGVIASGTYSLSATVSGCSNTAKMFAVVDSLPSVNVSATPSTICEGGTSVLSDVVTGPTAFTVYAIPYSITALTSPTTLNSGSSWTGGTGDGYINVSVPFTFTLYGVGYNTVNISANGYVNFGTGFASGGSTPFTLPSSSGSAPKSLVALFWHDMKVTSGTITYGTMGSAPNRKFIINYNAIPDVSGGQTNTGQIVLYETSNNIDLMVSNTAASTKTCGVQNSTGTLAKTASGQNNANYAITSAAPHGWRFGTPSYNYTWTPAATLSSSVVSNPSSVGLTATQIFTVNTVDQYSYCSGLTSNTTVTVNADPVIASVSASNNALCTGGSITLTSATPSGGVGTFTSYVWAGPGGYASTVSSIGTTTVTTSPTVTGVYSVFANYSGSGCTSLPATTSVTVAAQPNISAVTPTSPNICLGSPVTLTATVTGGIGTASYTWSGSVITTTTGSSAASPEFTPTVSGVGNYTAVVAYTGLACNNATGTTTVNIVPQQWVGGTPFGLEYDWNTPANWTCGSVPVLTQDVTIASGYTYAPDIAAAASGTVRSLTLAAGTALTVNSGATINIKGNLTSGGTITGTGNAVLNGSSPQTIVGTGTVNSIELNNSTGATIQAGSRMTVNKVLTMTSGSLATNDSLILSSSDTFATARVAPITPGSSITGNVNVQQYIQGGYRRFRFWSHPFNAAMSLGQLQNTIDITGSGGSVNGFRTTGSNAPSAFRYDPTVANSSLSYDPGWKPFTNITPAADDSNKLNRYQGIRLFLRGAKGEGIGYWFTYTPSDTIIGMTGAINQGDQTITLTKGVGSDQDYNMVGNPYPSPVDIGTVLHNALVSGDIVGSAFYVWNPSIGASGMYQAIPINTVSATPYYLPAFTAFQVRTALNGSTISVAETDKANSASNYLFKAPSDIVSLHVYDANYHLWDELSFRFSDQATDEEDRILDAKKLSGTDFSFYSLSSDSKKLVIDSRPYDADKVIPVGINSAYAQDYIIKAENVALPVGGQLFLHDKLLQKYVALEAGTEYRFTISKDKQTQGENRFEISMKPAAVTPVVSGLHVTMTPNPATDDVKIKFTSGKEDNVSVRVLDMSGISVYNEDFGAQKSGIISLPLSKLASGIYMVELTSGKDKVVQRLVKE